MTTAAPILSASFSQTSLRQKVEANLDTKRLFSEIDKIPQLHGAGVVYIDANMLSVELRPFVPLCRIKPIKIILREKPEEVSPALFSQKLQHDTNDARLVGYAVGTALSCGAAILGWIVVVSSGSTAPLTFGATMPLTVMSISAASASTVQCVTGGTRAAFEYADPRRNDLLDSMEWFTTMEKSLDIISLAGASAAGAITYKMWRLTRSISSRSTKTILRGMSRAERKRMTVELAKANNPHLPNRTIKKLIQTGDIPKRLSRVEMNSLLSTQVKDALGGTLSFGGSAASGTLNSIAVGIYQEIDE